MAGLMHSWRVDKNDLTVVTRNYALDAVACRLRFVRDSGYLFANEVVEESRFAGVRPADERDVAAAKRLFGHYKNGSRLRFRMQLFGNEGWQLIR